MDSWISNGGLVGMTAPDPGCVKTNSDLAGPGLDLVFG
jgi:hypothetical protein